MQGAADCCSSDSPARKRLYMLSQSCFACPARTVTHLPRMQAGPERGLAGVAASPARANLLALYAAMLRRGIRPPNEFTFTMTGWLCPRLAVASSASWKPACVWHVPHTHCTISSHLWHPKHSRHAGSSYGSGASQKGEWPRTLGHCDSAKEVHIHLPRKVRQGGVPEAAIEAHACSTGCSPYLVAS